MSMVRSPLEDIPPFDQPLAIPELEPIPYIWGPLPYLRRKRANVRARLERRRLRRIERRRAAAVR